MNRNIFFLSLAIFFTEFGSYRASAGVIKTAKPSQVLVIAHCGDSGHGPESTMAAFRMALDKGAKAIELDVHQTKDNVLVVAHDEDLKRVSRPPVHAKISDFTAKELSLIDVGSWFDQRYAGERIPRLEEVLDLADGKAEVHVEIKAGSKVYPGIERRVVDILKSRKSLDRNPISSFDHSALYKVRSLESQARLGYLTGNWRNWTWMPKAYREMAALKAESLNITSRRISPRMVRAAHAKGLKVFVYTINTQEELDAMVKMGVDGVYSNFPELKVR